MMKIEETVKKLNHALNSVDFDKENFNSLLGSLIEKENVKLKLLDFEFYNEKRREAVRMKKLDRINFDFGRAADWRCLEKIILKQIELREKFNVKRTQFYYDGEYLYYLYFGAERNDKKVKGIVKKKAIPRTEMDEF